MITNPLSIKARRPYPNCHAKRLVKLYTTYPPLATLKIAMLSKNTYTFLLFHNLP